MTKDDNLCFEDTAVFDFTFDFFFFCLLVPVSVCLCAYVWYKLHKVRSSTMTVPTAVFVAVVLCFELVGSWALVFQYSFLKLTYVPIPYCATMDFFAWFLSGATYVALQQMLLMRLKVAFDGSVHALKRRVIVFWNVLHISIIVVSIVILSVRAAVTNCVVHYRAKGWAANIGVVASKGYYCKTRKKHFYLLNILVAIGTVFAFFGNCALAWMYLHRLYLVFIKPQRQGIVRGNPSANLRTQALIRKSAMAAMSSILTTFIAMCAAAGGWTSLAYADAILNLFFFFSLFKSGQHWYDATLRRCEWIAIGCAEIVLPKESGQLQDKAEIQLTVLSATVQSESRPKEPTLTASMPKDSSAKSGTVSEFV